MIRKTALLCLAVAVAFVASALAADITGTWKAAFDTQIGVQNYTYTFKVEGTKLTGHAKSEYSDVDISEGTIKGDDISFVENFDFQGMPLRIAYKGKISGDEIKLSRNVADLANEEATAKRVK
jgi:opacity protein-like surface antigen